MKRFLLAVLLTLVAAAPAQAADWRPPAPDRLAALDVEMVPLLADYQPAFDAMVSDFTVMDAFYKFTGVAAVIPAYQAKLDAAYKITKDIKVMLDLAHDALVVLERYPPEACWAPYWAATLAGFTAYGDGADALRVGAMDDAGKYMGVALALLGAYGTLLHDTAVKDCAL